MAMGGNAAGNCFRASRMHAFSGNPLISSNSPVMSVDSALASIRSLLKEKEGKGSERILAMKKGKPLVMSCYDATAKDVAPAWRLAWQSADKLQELLEERGEEGLVYVGHLNGVPHWALDVGDAKPASADFEGGRCAFVELRTLMVAADWSDAEAMSQLSIVGHARAMLEWHSLSQFCSFCSTKLLPVDAGRRRQCQNDVCKRKFYPRVDPVVIMLVIDKSNDRALLSRQSRFVPRMWSCLAGFIEPGESLEEAVRRETLEEVGIEVEEVIYHSSQPWPVGPSNMPCQLMVGFFAIAKTYDICVDKKELEDAQWHSREDVKKALSFAEYEKAQKTSAFRVHQICGGVEKGQGLTSDFNVETGELTPMFVPGPFAIAHHLISSWANTGADALFGGMKS